MAIKHISGDLIKLAKEGMFDVIAHGCNCFCIMGSGIAKQIAKEFPEAYLADQKTKSGSFDKLGTITYTIEIGDKRLTVVNAYTQFAIGGDRPVSYDAIENCFQRIKNNFSKLRIGIPRIGAGLGGGNLQIITTIIEETCPNMDITMVKYEK